MPLTPRPAPSHLEVEAATGGCGGHCTCGHGDAEAPRLDVRQIPPAVRHPAILGALSGVGVGGSLVLVAPHEPVPLLRELEEREPDAFLVHLEQEGPDEWHVRLTRR
ncbi:MAG: DUF2249 domain-containing protein [Frankiales bacterium]|nr:DUF2249 domain-containing protein [Frankiales bacterium]